MTPIDELKVAKIIKECGGVDGRVKLQKIVYLLTQMGYRLPFYDFRILTHGPFSRRLAMALDFLTDAGVVKERPTTCGAVQPRFDYSVEGNWPAPLDKVAEMPAPSGRLGLAEDAKALVKEDRATLEIAATMVFLRREEGRTDKDLARELHSLKGHLPAFEERRKEAESLLSILGFSLA